MNRRPRPPMLTAISWISFAAILVLAILLFVAAAATGIIAANKISNGDGLQNVVLPLALAGASNWLYRFSRRLLRLGVSVEVDGPFVLLLRSFTIDSKDIAGQRRLPGETPLVTIDEALREACAPLPVLKVLPKGDLPDLGSEAIVIDEADWRPRVRDYISRASSIVVILGRSPGLLWEISQLKEQNALAKCVFILPRWPTTRAGDGTAEGETAEATLRSSLGYSAQFEQLLREQRIFALKTSSETDLQTVPWPDSELKSRSDYVDLLRDLLNQASSHPRVSGAPDQPGRS